MASRRAAFSGNTSLIATLSSLIQNTCYKYFNNRPTLMSLITGWLTRWSRQHWSQQTSWSSSVVCIVIHRFHCKVVCQTWLDFMRCNVHCALCCTECLIVQKTKTSLYNPWLAVFQPASPHFRPKLSACCHVQHGAVLCIALVYSVGRVICSLHVLRDWVQYSAWYDSIRLRLRRASSALKHSTWNSRLHGVRCQWRQIYH